MMRSPVDAAAMLFPPNVRIINQEQCVNAPMGKAFHVSSRLSMHWREKVSRLPAN